MSRSFDGTDDEINFGSNVIGSITEVTIFVWFYLNAITSDQSLLSDEDGVGATGILFFFDDVVGAGPVIDTIGIRVNDTNTGQAVLNGPTGLISTNRWYWAALTFLAESTTGLRLYVDGNEVSTSPVTTVGVIDSGGGGRNLFAGERNGSTMDLNGFLAHAQVWRRVLTLNELKQAAIFPGSVRRELYLHAPLWGGSPEPDYSGNKNFGSVTGALLSNNNPPINRVFGYRRPRLWYSAFSTAAANNVVSTKLSILNSTKLSVLDKTKMTLIGF